MGWCCFGLLVIGIAMLVPFRHRLLGVITRLKGRKTVTEVVQTLSPSYPEIAGKKSWGRLRMVAYKQEQMLELWEQDEQETWHLRKSWPFTGFSGELGPKLREGDRQIPEGVYWVLSLNPNSRYHLSVELDYPNAFDRKWAEHEGRFSPGSDIFIHGKAVTVGCIPIGDSAIEELFLILALAGFENTEVVLAPNDLRQHPPPDLKDPPRWLGEKYARITSRLLELPEGASGETP